MRVSTRPAGGTGDPDLREREALEREYLESRTTESKRSDTQKSSSRPRSGGKVSAKKAAPSTRSTDILGISILTFGLIALLALATRNTGVLGDAMATVFETFFGRGAWAVPVVAGIMGVALLRGRGLAVTHLVVGLSLIFVSMLFALAAPVQGDFFDPVLVQRSGGYLGAVGGWALSGLLGVAKPVAIGGLGLIGLVLCVDVPIRVMLSETKRAASKVAEKTRTVTTQRKASPAKELGIRDRELPEKGLPEKGLSGRALVEPEASVVAKGGTALNIPDVPPVLDEAASSQTKRAELTKAKGKAEPTLEFSPDDPTPKEGYQLPPINLLAEAVLQPTKNPVETQRNIETLEGTLDQFGIEASVVHVATGPTVTRYEIQLGPGVRVNRITALADNIAMDMAASHVRVEAPIPGKAAIGVEVPNSISSMVTLRELCEEPKFRNHSSRLAVALGKDVSGEVKYADLAKMPHLLIGGATNSGKSIGLATLITSLLMRNTPKDVRLVMIDPKRVELTLFDSVPHLMCPVIKDVKEAAGVLRAVWREMDRRYDLFSEHGVRNIDGWNEKASFVDKLPYIVVIIDELADLMIQCGNEVETVIVRLAQLARAVGIHMVIATQRPSVDVITGLIKANIPSRIAFSVASYIDSRTILDLKGAETLIGRGDMLFKPIDANKPMRVQGCYVSEKEIDAVCKFWRAQQSPDYILQPVEAEGAHDERREGGDFGGETDPLWEDAIRWAVERGQASTSMLQRKFSIGFQRASRLLDMMEERGIVGAREGTKPREVLVSALELDSLFGAAPRYDVGRTIGDGLDE